MKIIKISQENPFRNEGKDPLESPEIERFEAEQDLIKDNNSQKDNYDLISEHIEKMRAQIYQMQKDIMRFERERDYENWEFFKERGILKSF